MASVMGICGGLVGPKAEMLVFYWFLKVFLKGQERHEDARAANNPLSRTVWEGEGGG